jgi:MFS family permease
MKHPFFHWPHYLHQHLAPQLKGLFATVGIQDFALAAIVIFEPVYLYNQGFAISQILWYYVLVYGLYFLLIPFGGALVARRGPARGIAISTVWLIGYYVALLLMPQAPWLFWIAPICFALQKTFYWPAYHADFAASSNSTERGKEYSSLYSLTTLMYVLGPLFGGAVLKFAGFSTLFTIVIALIAISNIPVWRSSVKHIPQPFSFRQTWRLPFRPIHRRSTLSYLAMGEQLIYLVVWPIFIALTFKDFLNMGEAIALATLITALVTLISGRWLDRGHWRPLLKVGGLLTAVVWFTRPWLNSIVGVFTSDTFGRIGGNTTWVTNADVTYERALKEQNVIGRSIMFEQGLSIGKALIAVLVIIVSAWWPPFTAAFILAGVFSLGYLLLR